MEVDEYMERWHDHQQELKEGGAPWYLACLQYGHLPDVCPYEDPLFVKSFDRGELETVEEWIHLKTAPSAQTDPDTCLICLKGEEWCFACAEPGYSTMCGLLQPPAPKRKKGRSGHPRKKGKKPVQAPGGAQAPSAHKRGAQGSRSSKVMLD
ncbi:UNVERIFIED_CONTAM: hypothetical protein FKN15_061829 [Acipenser sinensis]